MKKVLLLIGMICLLTGCKKEPVNPYDVLNDFVTAWQDNKYTQMYNDYLSSEVKDKFTLQMFEEKHREVYDFFEMENLEIEVIDNEIDWEEQETISIPANISYDTFARKVDFDVEFVMEKVLDEDDNDSWYLDWQPTFIFPEYEFADSFEVTYTRATRGEIFDNKGNKLAANEEVMNLGIVPGQFNAENDLTKLASMIDMSEEEITKRYTVSWAQDDQLMYVKNFREKDRPLVLEAIEIGGVTNHRSMERVYPYEEATAHLVGYIDEVTSEDLEKYDGYVAGDRIGQAGIEGLYEDRLKGKKGIEVTQVKEDGTEKTVARTEPERGEDITLTIDADIQTKLYETMKDDVGQATVIDPTTGEVLSLLSVPAYDPNRVTLGPSLSKETPLKDLSADTSNRFRYTYSPGSTMKLLTSIIGLESGKLDPSHQYDIPEKQWNIGGSTVTRVYSDDKRVDLRSGMNNSDNIYFAMAGVDIGAKDFEDGLKKLGIGEELPFAYPIQGNSQISNNGTFDNDVLLAHTAYGQGEFLINIVHLASIYGGIVNDGSMMKPMLINNENPEIWKEIASTENAQLLQKLLRTTVTEGKSNIANLPGREIAGKTGTAEINKEEGIENGLWVSYDQKDPTLITAMLIEDVLEKGGSRHTIELTSKFYQALSQ
ncbi:penicillin-binding transpeptidase domain-containing protein [Sutcliffiella rhizosphaerae]|uniref:serine-type D-Ala-D-Ala carboxypeptidase n=1 Tax=Sutcliffiella rhizosphaerae TaxID=2880967 RepID=A0ABN8ACD7_9BACI|nr:penicillin-binding transpeptidase domain-containing protein [Sutcliffiella rhizosphaerae]CAG9621621.1 Beta-lactam-inducible penicillin-binding protein [Sutcliffiella rhizosphaerae]